MVSDDDLVAIQDPAPWPGFADALADCNKKPYDMILRKPDQAADFGEIREVHGARVITQGLGRKHEGLGGDPAGAHGLVALYGLAVPVIAVDGRKEALANFGRGVAPIAFWLFLPGLEIGTDRYPPLTVVVRRFTAFASSAFRQKPPNTTPWMPDPARAWRHPG